MNIDLGKLDNPQEKAVDLTGLSVMIGMPTHRDINPKTVKCLLETIRGCEHMGIPVNWGVAIGLVTNARDEVADMFLNSDYSRLFWIDSDMIWDFQDFMRLLALSQDYDVLCAAYPAKVEQPTFYVKHDLGKGLIMDSQGLTEIEGTGLGFTVVSREVMEKLAYVSEKVTDELSGRKVASIFRLDSFEGKRRTEDLAFFADIRDEGYPVLLDTTISLGHIGQKIYKGNIMDAFKTNK